MNFLLKKVYNKHTATKKTFQENFFCDTIKKMKTYDSSNPLRLGILSTAGINTMAIFNVIDRVEGMRVQAVASRNLAAAEKYANKHGVPQAYGSYDDILNLPFIAAVYIPLPNSMHAEWTIKALEAGKHVLCEKPMAVSAEEAQDMLRAQKKSGKILMEAFHYRYHPLALKVEEIVRGGDIGDVTEINTGFCQWLTGSNKVGFNKNLAGGVLWDMGCYCVNAARWLAGCDDAAVTSAEMKMMRTGVDHTARASLEFSNGIKANIYTTFRHFFPVNLIVKGTRGSLYVFAPFNPVIAAAKNVRVPIYRMTVKRGVVPKPYFFPMEATYTYQLCAFRDAIRDGKNFTTTGQDGLANTKLIEAIRVKAGAV